MVLATYAFLAPQLRAISRMACEGIYAFAPLIVRIAAAPELIGGGSIWRLEAFVNGYYDVASVVDQKLSGSAQGCLDALRKEFIIELGLDVTYGAYSLASLMASDDQDAFRLFIARFREHSFECDPNRYPVSALVAPDRFSLAEVINRIRTRPEMFLGAKTLTRLRAYLDGYTLGASDCGQDATRSFQPQHFSNWLRAKYRFAADCRWERIILFLRNFEEGEALKLFFELFDEYFAHNPFGRTAA